MRHYAGFSQIGSQIISIHGIIFAAPGFRYYRLYLYTNIKLALPFMRIDQKNKQKGYSYFLNYKYYIKIFLQIYIYTQFMGSY